MKEARVGSNQPFIADDEAPKVAQPGKRPFYDPSAAVPSQLAAILMGGVLMVPPRGDEGFNPPVSQAGAQRITVIATVRDQALGPLAGPPSFARPADGDRIEGRFEECNFGRGRRVQGCSQRSTRAIDQNHPLCTLAPLGLPDFGPPFFAGTKLPSTKHSSQRSFCWSLSWARKARQSLRSTPVSSQVLSRRQQVLGLPYRRGRSLHWAPVHRIQRIPSKQRRSSTRGRPPRADIFNSGRWTRMASHCGFVSPRHAMSCLLLLPGNSWPYVTLTSRF
jgi:hypothetical protein